MVGSNVIACRDGTWDGTVPDCDPFCPGIEASVTFLANCNYQNVNVNCTEPAKAGTVATVRCKYGYEGIPNEERTTCGADGQWQPVPSPCTQICGERTPGPAAISHLPWHVSIYRQPEKNHTWQYRCAGTIVSAKVIVSVSHSLWDDAIFYELFELRIKTGKSLREYDDDREMNNVQTLSIQSLQNSHEFPGRKDGILSNDIALITLKEYIEFNPYTMPICMWPDLEYEETYVTPGLKGLVGSWGADDSSASASAKSIPTLNVAELSVIAREKCIKNTPTEHRKHITNDKYCAERSKPGVGLCDVDSGSGLVFPTEINGKVKYFLRGVASIAICGHDHYSTFANIIYTGVAIYFMIDKTQAAGAFARAQSMSTATISQGCQLTVIPKNGYVSYMIASTVWNLLVLDQDIANNLVIRYFCNENYTLKGKVSNACLNNRWTNSAPECVMKPSK